MTESMSGLKLYAITYTNDSEHKKRSIETDTIFEDYGDLQILNFLYDILEDISEEINILMDNCKDWAYICSRDAYGLCTTNMDETYKKYHEQLKLIYNILSGNIAIDPYHKPSIYNIYVLFKGLCPKFRWFDIENIYNGCLPYADQVIILADTICGKLLLNCKQLNSKIKRTGHLQSVILYGSTMSLFIELKLKIQRIINVCQEFVDFLESTTVEHYVSDSISSVTGYDPKENEEYRQQLCDFNGLLK